MKEADPLRYERLFSRLHSTVVAAREGARRIAASPGVREVGEMVVTLYTPEGDAVTLSTGILVHVHTTSRFIKWMIRHDYEDDPGINPGDDVALAQERFSEGMFVCAEKVGTNDDLRRDYVIRCERNLREPIYWIMDEKAKVSSCLEVRDRVLELIGEIGADVYLKVVREF